MTQYNSTPNSLSPSATPQEILSFYLGLAMSNAISHQQATNQLQLSAVQSIMTQINELPPKEALGLLKQAQSIFNNTKTIKDMADSIREIKAMLELI